MNARTIHRAAALTIMFAFLMPAQKGDAKKKKERDGGPKTYVIDEVGVEITLPGCWFPQPTPVDKKIVKMITSLRDLSQITVTPIPYQVSINDKNYEKRLDELVLSVKKSHPDFQISSDELIPGHPARLHVEGRWQVEGKSMNVCMEVFPVKGKSALLVLTIQKTSGNKFRVLADLIKHEIIIFQKPVPLEAPDHVDYRLEGAEVMISLPEGWRPSIDEEKDFLKIQMADDGLFTEEDFVTDQILLVFPTLKNFSPSLTIRSSHGAIPVSYKNLDKFNALVKSHMATRGTFYKIDKISIDTLGGISSFVVEGTAERSNFNIKSRQFFVPAADSTVITTLSYPEGDRDLPCRECGEILAGITFNIDAPEEKISETSARQNTENGDGDNRPFLMWIVGGLALLMTTILLISMLAKLLRKK